MMLLEQEREWLHIIRAAGRHMAKYLDQMDLPPFTAHFPLERRFESRSVRNGCSVTVRMNHRGPYGRGRIIDVSNAAARALGMIGAGTVRVRVDRQ